jgi:hypothetical protein
MVDYNKCSNEDFDRILRQIVKEEGANLLDVPGVLELVSEYFNNEVLERWEEEQPEEEEEDGPAFDIGSWVKIASDSDNENYNDFRGLTLVVMHVTRNSKEHMAYDEGMSPQGLYDLETLDGKEVPFSLYDCELEEA